MDNGKIVLSSGVTTEIDMALHVVQGLFGDGMVNDIRKTIEYEWDTSVVYRVNKVNRVNRVS